MRNTDTRRYEKLIEEYKQKYLKATTREKKKQLRHEFCNRTEFKSFAKE